MAAGHETEGGPAPIIVKKYEIVEGGHHGGAWKVAYADFVTAMMAFFLLMWLLGSTAKGDLQGIASYFNSPLQVAMPGGSGAGNSSSIIPGGGTDLTRTNGQVRRSEGQNNDRARMNDDDRKAQMAKQDARRIAALREKIDGLLNENAILREFRSQIRMEVTPDGLEIQIVDAQNRPMFDTGAALVKPYMRDILRAIGTSLNNVENRVSLAGHTDGAPYGNGDRGYGNWELSADRANASRRELVASGMPDDKLVRVVGLAASDLLDKNNALSPVNRRISITVLTHEAEARLLGTRRMDAPDAVKAIAEQVAARDHDKAVASTQAALAAAN